MPRTSRRDVLQGLLAGVGAGSALPASADAHPLPALAKDRAPTSPEFLDVHQFETLTSLCEMIVPGSTGALVAPFIDRILAVDTQENQRQFLNALGGIEGESIARYAHPWRGLTAVQRVELLTAASTATPGKEAQRFTLRDRFDHLKGWIAGAYYSSEIGMRELGWTGNTFFASFPGCEHRDGH